MKPNKSLSKAWSSSKTESSTLLLLFATSIHGHDEGLVGGILAIRVSCLLPDVLDIVQVLKHLIRGQDLDVECVVNVEFEGSDALQLRLAFHVGAAGVVLQLLLLVVPAAIHIL